MSIQQYTDYILLNADDFLKYRVSTSFSKVSTKAEIIDDTFFLDESTRVLTAQSSNTKSGGFNFFFPNTKTGDEIEVECEIRSVSGENPRFYFSEVSTPDSTGIEANSTYSTVDQQGQWEYINQKMIIKNTTYTNNKIFIGLITSAAGKYQLRNLKIRLKRSIFTRKQERILGFTVNKYNGNWVTDEYSYSDPVTFSYSGNSLKLTFEQVFNKKPIVQITPSNGAAAGYKIIGAASNDSVLITFLDSSNNAVSAETIVSNNTIFHVVIIGKSS